MTERLSPLNENFMKKITQGENMEHVQEKESAATKFVLERLKAAGIEVVTDKEEFNRILKAEKLLQKMAESGENPEKIERQRQIINGLVVNQKSLGLSEDNIANAFKQLDRSLRFNANFEIQSEKLGEEVSVFPGSTGKHGLGIRHIIEERTKKDGLSLDEITALSSLIVDAVQTGDITRDSENRCEISKNGIIAIVRKDLDNGRKNWILTGFHYGGEDVEKNREATETVQTVIAKYGQSPDYSYFRSQVGAVIASLDLNISQSPIKSSGVSKIADQNSEAEVKDSAISVTSLKTETVNKKASIRSPDDTYRLLSHVKNEGREHFGVILLDEAYNVKAINTVSVGTKNKSLVHPREVFSEAIRAKAASMIVFHNHPSGNPLPSDEDLNTTRALLKVSEVVDVPIIDHVIATKNSYYSFLEQGILDDLKPKAEFLIKNNRTYGFTHNGKIYLDPEVMNSDAAVHEYTHLWDKYIQTTNLTLWEQGKEIFSKTHLWKEVKDDPNYADISSDDDLILSEIHSRICGKIAEQVLERIASEDGEITRGKAIDWNKEAWDYLSSEFLTVEDKEILFEGKSSKDQINEFISLSLKDLMEEKDISLSQSMEQSRISSIEKTISETISQKKSREENMENENSTTMPDLRTHNRLKEDDIRNLEVITDEDFSDIIDSMLLNDYRHIPNVIRLPNIRGDLAEKLGLEKDAAFIMKNGISHIRPARKGAYEQAFDDEEYRSIPKIIREATFAVIDKRYNNFQFVFDDEENEKMINKIVFNKDKLGNYLVTVGKVNRRDSFSEAINEVVGVGVAPTISALRGEPPATRLRPSPTTEDSIAQEYKPVNEKENRADETPDILKEPKVEINGEMTENLSLFKDNRWIDGREMPVEIIASAIDYISEKTEYSASNSDDIDSIPEEIRKDAISVALKNHIKDGKYSYLLDFKNNLRQEAFAGEVNRLSSNFKDTAKLMFETLNGEFSMERITQGENMENEGKANETIEKKLENKGARENRRAVADLDLEYQRKASKIADLDLEYPYKNRFSKKEFSGAWVPFNNAKTIKEEMEYNEKLVPFLPNEKGEINARPIYNANTGDCLVLKDLLPMQVKMDTVMSLEKDGEIKIGDFYTPIAATKKSIDAAHTSIKTGERGVFYNFKRKDGTIGTSQYFFPEQTESPDKVIQSAHKKILERHKEIGGENNVASRPPITITSSEPKEYLGKYYAAMITNSALKCSPEIGREFKEKFNAVLENQLADKKDFNPKIGTLHNLFFEAGKVSSDIIKQMKREGARPQAQQKELKRNRKPEMSR